MDDADVVLLAGDIDYGLDGIRMAGELFQGRQVLYVAGNHEYYGHSIPDLTEELKTQSIDGVRFLENEAVAINGVRFLGCTLWTDFNLFGKNPGWYMADARRGMMDYEAIHHDGRPLKPSYTVALHQGSRTWLEAELGREFDGPTVVLTHHAPSIRSIAPRFSGDSLNPAFASNLEDLVKEFKDSSLVLWVHGHMHDAFDYEIRGYGPVGTRVVCNPRGYASECPPRVKVFEETRTLKTPPRDNLGFVPRLVMEI